jgi:hypothetical protein
MFSGNEIQALLLGAGGFIGTSMAGVGAYRLFAAATRGVWRIPAVLEKAAVSMERMALAVETQNAVSNQVTELKGLLMTTREDILKLVNDRELIGRELRLISRKIETFGCCAQDE